MTDFEWYLEQYDLIEESYESEMARLEQELLYRQEQCNHTLKVWATVGIPSHVLKTCQKCGFKTREKK